MLRLTIEMSLNSSWKTLLKKKFLKWNEEKKEENSSSSVRHSSSSSSDWISVKEEKRWHLSSVFFHDEFYLSTWRWSLVESQWKFFLAVIFSFFFSVSKIVLKKEKIIKCAKNRCKKNVSRNSRRFSSRSLVAESRFQSADSFVIELNHKNNSEFSSKTAANGDRNKSFFSVERPIGSCDSSKFSRENPSEHRSFHRSRKPDRGGRRHRTNGRKKFVDRWNLFDLFGKVFAQRKFVQTQLSTRFPSILSFTMDRTTPTLSVLSFSCLSTDVKHFLVRFMKKKRKDQESRWLIEDFLWVSNPKGNRSRLVFESTFTDLFSLLINSSSDRQN